MKPSAAIRTLGLISLFGLFALPAVGEVDRSQAPGGVYRLKPGIYVSQGSKCSRPANAAIRLYDGRGITTAHTRSCRVTVLSKKGYVYKVTQSCLDAGAGPAKRFTERQTVDVRDALTFKQTVGRRSATYHYCPTYELPKDLQGMLEP